MTKKKRNIIILCSVLVALIGLLVTLCLTTFSLKSISVDFRTSTMNVTATQEEIIGAGKFSKKCVLFYNKDKAKENIEEAYPYLKVINIETKFPSSFVIHVAERQEVYAVTDGEKTAFLDEGLKVLRVESGEFVSTQSNAILLKGITLSNGVKVSQRLPQENYVDLYSAFLQSNLTLGMQKEIFKEIEFKVEKDENAKKDYLNVYISLYSGQTIKILDVNYALKYKANRAYNVYSSLYTFIGKDYTLRSGETITLTKEHLDSASICVQSYYDRAHHKESETYFVLDLAL